MIRNEGKAGPNGVYKSFLNYGDVEKMYDDFMHTVIYGPPGTGKTEIAKLWVKYFPI
jgi:DNA replication protein DnaC